MPLFDSDRNEYDKEKYIAVESVINGHATNFTVYSVIGCWTSLDGVLIREPMLVYKVDSENCNELLVIANTLQKMILEDFDQVEAKVELFELTPPYMYFLTGEPVVNTLD